MAVVQPSTARTQAAAPSGPLPTTTVRDPLDVAAIAVVRSPGSQPVTGVHARPSADSTPIAIAGGCCTPTARKPPGIAAMPNSWLAAAGWHGEHWYPGGSDGAWVTISGWTTSADAQAAGSADGRGSGGAAGAGRLGGAGRRRPETGGTRRRPATRLGGGRRRATHDEPEDEEPGGHEAAPSVRAVCRPTRVVHDRRTVRRSSWRVARSPHCNPVLRARRIVPGTTVNALPPVPTTPVAGTTARSPSPRHRRGGDRGRLPPSALGRRRDAGADRGRAGRHARRRPGARPARGTRPGGREAQPAVIPAPSLATDEIACAPVGLAARLPRSPRLLDRPQLDPGRRGPRGRSARPGHPPDQRSRRPGSSRSAPARRPLFDAHGRLVSGGPARIVRAWRIERGRATVVVLDARRDETSPGVATLYRPGATAATDPWPTGAVRDRGGGDGRCRTRPTRARRPARTPAQPGGAAPDWFIGLAVGGAG